MNTQVANNSSSLIDRLIERRWAFLGAFFMVFFATYLLLVAIDFVPEPAEPTKIEVKDEDHEPMIPQAAEVDVAAIEPSLPTEIYIERLDKKIAVLNPTSRNVEDLDNALLRGVVRHPDSAKLGQEGNVFILGHSSYLPSVFNSNFKAFNGIQDLEWGDTIEIKSEGAVFVYRVDKVYRAEAQELVVPIAGDKKRLTLATCDSFGSADDRFIVEATEIEVRSL